MLEILRGQLVDTGPAEFAAGKGDLCHLGMSDQRLAHLFAEAGHHVQHARRKTCHLGQTRQFQRRGRGIFRRLQHKGVARRQSGSQLVHRQQQRRIPRGDRNADPQRLIAGEGEGEGIGLIDGKDSAFHLVGQTAEVMEILRQIAHRRRYFADQLAVVGDLDADQPVGMFGDQLAKAAQQLAPRAGGHHRPWAAAKGGVGSGDGGFGIGGTAARDRRPSLAVPGVDRLKALAPDRFDSLATDEHPIGFHGPAPHIVPACASRAISVSSRPSSPPNTAALSAPSPRPV